MEKYQVEIVEKLRKVIDVDADSIKDAENKVKDLYDKKEIVLNHDDLLLTEFNGKFGKTLEELQEMIISEFVKENQKRHSEQIKASIRLKKQMLDIDNEKNQEMER